jgi:DNA-binding transcriptional MerR regulator
MSFPAVEIPNRSLFRQPEVCDIAQVQPYVLRSWEAEFPELGITKTKGGPRMYRRGDVELVLRIKHLVYVDGLTLAGARRKLAEERPALDEPSDLDELLGSDVRERLTLVKRSLRDLHTLLSGRPGNGGALMPFELRQPTRAARPPAKRTVAARAPVKKKKRAH